MTGRVRDRLTKQRRTTLKGQLSENTKVDNVTKNQSFSSIFLKKMKNTAIKDGRKREKMYKWLVKGGGQINTYDAYLMARPLRSAYAKMLQVCQT